MNLFGAAVHHLFVLHQMHAKNAPNQTEDRKAEPLG
jgi:hypothetical protein